MTGRGASGAVSRRAVLLGLLGSISTTLLACSQAGAAPGGPSGPSAPSGPTGTVAPAAGSFRSVRDYPGIAEPVRLRIPALGVDTALQRLGRAADMTIEVPKDFQVAGWFAEGPRPGGPGPAVIIGHVDSASGPAVFGRLRELAPGAEVLVDRADGATVAFRVSGLQQVPKNEFPTAQVYGPTLEPALRLVTCGGSFDVARHSYRENVIVYADPAG